jgi:hypothetical protein
MNGYRKLGSQQLAQSVAGVKAPSGIKGSTRRIADRFASAERVAKYETAGVKACHSQFAS